MAEIERTPGDEPVSNFAGIDEAAHMSEAPEHGEGDAVEIRDDNSFEEVAGYEPNAGNFGLEALEALEATVPIPLRPIGEASFGPAVFTETVHGEDDRVQIQGTSKYPWRAHASLRVTAADDSMWIGTGWFVGPRLLVTAGHVVHIKGSGVEGRDGWVKRMVVMPGRNGADEPYGHTTSSRFWSVRGWTDGPDQNYDYGAIVLDEPLGARTGWFGFGSFNDLSGVRANVSGYPGDKPSGTQWYASRVIDSFNDRKVYYDIDTFGGQSGSAAYRIKDGHRYGIAIHAYGGAQVNSGTRINKPVFDNIKAWKDASEA